MIPARDDQSIDDGYLLGAIFQGKIGPCIDTLMRNGWTARSIFDKLDSFSSKDWIIRAPGEYEWRCQITNKGEDALMRLVPMSRERVKAARDLREMGILRNGK